MPDRFTKGANGFDRHKGARVGTLWSNDVLDGDVTLHIDFDELNLVNKLDLLNDFIGLLERERDALIEEEGEK